MRILWVPALIILIDQFTKIWVRTTMYVGESIPLVGSWLRLTFTENPGMAFGLQLGSTSLVTAFSLVATLLIIVYLWQMQNAPLSYRASIAVVLGGAIGNIIDRIFYGKLFAYADYFSGQVVDFIHVDIWRGVAADWIPLLGGQAVALFPIWNVADMAIVLGVVGMLGAQHKLKAVQQAPGEGARSGEERLASDEEDQSLPVGSNGQEQQQPPPASPSTTLPASESKEGPSS